MKEDYSINIPTDGDFIGRQCPAIKCNRYFEIHVNNSDCKEIICPYCTVKHPIETTHTAEQIKYAKAKAVEDIMEDVAQEFNSALSDSLPTSNSRASTGWGVNISVETSPHKKRNIPLPPKKKMDTTLQCLKCDCSFRVEETSGCCPICGCEETKDLR